MERNGEMKKMSLVIVLVLFLTPVIFVACGDQKEAAKTETPVTSEEVKKQAGEAMETAVAYTQQQMHEYQNNIAAKLDDYSRKISELKAKSEEMTGDAKAMAEQKLADLQASKQGAEQKLKELKNASGKAWEDMKSGMDKAMESLAQAYKEAVSHF
jgi:hypothetical protein